MNEEATWVVLRLMKLITTEVPTARFNLEFARAAVWACNQVGTDKACAMIIQLNDEAKP